MNNKNDTKELSYKNYKRPSEKKSVKSQQTVIK